MEITDTRHLGLVRINPSPGTIYISQGRAVLATNHNGFVREPQHGLFVGETRMLSLYEHLIDGKAPQTVVISNVEQHSSLGYFIFPPPKKKWKPDTGSGEMEPVSEHTIEMRLSRTIGLGLHEDIDFTNYTADPVRFNFEIRLDADFRDQAELHRRKQNGRLRKTWHRRSKGGQELWFEYHAEHRYSHQGNHGTASIDRGLIVRIEKSDSLPFYHSVASRLLCH